MKKILILVAAVIVCFSSCYKEKKPAQAFDVLTRHQWKIFSHVSASVDTGVDCRMPSEVEFNIDSTGYFYYYTACDSKDVNKKPFRWVISYDNRNIHLYNLEGVPGTFLAIGLSNYNDTYLECHAPMYNGHFWDGNFISFADRKQ